MPNRTFSRTSVSEVCEDHALLEALQSDQGIQHHVAPFVSFGSGNTGSVAPTTLRMQSCSDGLFVLAASSRSVPMW